MNVIPLLVLLLAIVFSFLAAIGVPSFPRWNFGWGAFFCWLLYVLLAGLPAASLMR